MTNRGVVILGTWCLLVACHWHDREHDNANLPISCLGLDWSQAELTIEEVLPQESGAGEQCVPLRVGDSLVVTAAPACSAGLLSGKPTPAFILPFAPYCGLEDEPAFVCRETDVDGGTDDGNLIKVEMRGQMLLVDWNQKASGVDPGRVCSQRFRTSLETVDPASK